MDLNLYWIYSSTADLFPLPLFSAARQLKIVILFYYVVR